VRLKVVRMVVSSSPAVAVRKPRRQLCRPLAGQTAKPSLLRDEELPDDRSDMRRGVRRLLHGAPLQLIRQ
jgi:hypothetical protein